MDSQRLFEKAKHAQRDGGENNTDTRAPRCVGMRKKQKLQNIRIVRTIHANI